MAKLCTECVHCSRRQNDEYLCIRVPIETSIVDGQNTYWQCKDERSTQGVCGPDALNFESLKEWQENYYKDQDEKMQAHIKSLSWFQRFIYKAMLN